MNEKNIPIRSICVYCGSQPGRDQSFINAGRILGKSIAENHLRLVYGGGTKVKVPEPATLSVFGLTPAGLRFGASPEARLKLARRPHQTRKTPLRRGFLCPAIRACRVALQALLAETRRNEITD